MTETITHYTVTYSLADIQVDDEVVITPKQQREIAFKMKQAIDRVFENTLTGGYKIHVPHPGRIFEHAPTRPLLEKKP